MTETYNDPWDPMTGDRPKHVQDDPYHPRYPDAGPYQNQKAYGFIEKPVSDAAQLWEVVVSGSQVNGNGRNK